LSEIIAIVFLAMGLFFILTGSIGLVRFPDVYSRMHATGLISTLGICCILTTSLIFFNWVAHTLSIKELLLIVALLLTAPVGTHMIIQAAYRTKVPLWKRSITDELKGKELDSQTKDG
jgi:multicomponent Na+:H+ antiporter subunit G